jgi:hypothetical protein
MGGEPDVGSVSSCVSPSRPDAPAVSVAQVASSMAAIFCIAQVDCDCEGRSHDTTQSCRHSLNMEYEYVQEVAQTWGLTYDGACLGQLEAAVEALGCAVVEATDETFADILGLGHCAVYHGEREVGEACTPLGNVASHCAKGLACWNDVCVDPCGAESHGGRSNPYGFACPQGQAMAPGRNCAEPAEIGEPCGPVGCEPRAYCAQVCTGDVCGRQCMPTVGLGDPCELDRACGDNVCESGRCVQGPAEGTHCLDGRCGHRLRCEAGTCVKQPSICDLID